MSRTPNAERFSHGAAPGEGRRITGSIPGRVIRVMHVNPLEAYHGQHGMVHHRARGFNHFETRRVQVELQRFCVLAVFLVHHRGGVYGWVLRSCGIRREDRAQHSGGDRYVEGLDAPLGTHWGQLGVLPRAALGFGRSSAGNLRKAKGGKQCRFPLKAPIMRPIVIYGPAKSLAEQRPSCEATYHG